MLKIIVVDTETGETLVSEKVDHAYIITETDRKDGNADCGHNFITSDYGFPIRLALHTDLVEVVGDYYARVLHKAGAKESMEIINAIMKEGFGNIFAGNKGASDTLAKMMNARYGKHPAPDGEGIKQ